jgi:peptidoglycan/LPS O-acetylase OafA/YrhL
MPSTIAPADEKAAISNHPTVRRTAHAGSGLKYRADIDGLRAVAVLSVLAFHIGLIGFKGGFVGVDVFFVISGYLISSIIFAEIAGSRFTIAGFYERRIRRIFPALVAMLAVATVVAVVYLLPGELIDYAKSMLAATSSASNFYFWAHSGYFSSPTSKPLLHTWSLAVEEQFYILFPLFLMLVRRFFPQKLKTAVIVFFVLSLIASGIVVYRNQDTAFYMPYTRAWELLLGTLLSLSIFPRLQSAWSRNLATLGGMGMILWSVLRFSQETLFPGPSALLPCVGTAMIIWAGEAGGSLVSSVLSWRPVVFVGLISYSLYLWHWPVIVLHQMGMLLGLGSMAAGGRWAFLATHLSGHRLDMLIEVTLSFALGILSWRFVERPFRSGGLRLSGRPLFALTGIVLAVLMASALWTVKAQGFPGRFSQKALQVASALGEESQDKSLRTGVCFITTDYHFEKYNFDLCLHQDPSKKNYLLLGDSHSAMLWSALASALPASHVMQASTAACEPALAPSGSSDCKQMMSYIFQQYLPEHPVDALFVVGRWEKRDLGPLTQLTAWAKDHHQPVIVFGPVAEYDAPLPRLLAYSIAWNQPHLASEHRIDTKTIDAEMQDLAASTWHVPYISMYREICGAEGCLEYADAAHTIPLMGDTNHLSMPGAAFLVQRLVDKGELN